MKKILYLAIAIPLLTGCFSKQVARVDESETIDLSGRWNDTDSRLVAEEMVKDALSRFWLQEFTETKGRKPVLIIGSVKNKTSEHISSETFIKDIEREFVNSGRLKIVQSGDEREAIRQERADMEQFADPASAKKWGMEKGADFMLMGVISSITDSNGKQKVVYYQTDLELTNLESNEKAWIGTKKIKKVVK